MRSSRRHFLKTSAILAASTPTVSGFAKPSSILAPRRPFFNLDPDIKQLILTGVDAAKEAGATYADVRLTFRKSRNYQVGRGWGDQESMTVGVRTLVKGYWGFSGGTIWGRDEIVDMSRVAVSMAKACGLGKTRTVDLAPIPVVSDGHWATPVKIDPFEVSREEVEDCLAALVDYAGHIKYFGTPKSMDVKFTFTDKAFGSTEGSYFTQRIYTSEGGLGVSLAPLPIFLAPLQRSLNLTVSGEGWEKFRERPLRDELLRLNAEMVEEGKLPTKTVDIGRYDAVLDAASIVDLLNGSIGVAAQLDRAMGYEANADGTSYLNDPETMLDSFKVGNPLVTVTANRTAPGAAATVRWDDEGVTPEEFTIVRQGVLTDYGTTREGAGWLRALQPTRPFRSHGCAEAPEAVYPPLPHTPNLVLKPGSEAKDFDSLVADLPKGLAIKFAPWTMDFQELNGYGGTANLTFTMFQVMNGKKTARIKNGAMLIRAPEFWRSVQAIGGPNSVVRYGSFLKKGEPPQVTANSVDVVPVAVKDLTVIDRGRKA